jgi:hypothetical protein
MGRKVVKRGRARVERALKYLVIAILEIHKCEHQLKGSFRLLMIGAFQDILLGDTSKSVLTEQLTLLS